MPKKATGQNVDVVAGIDAKIQGVIAEIDAQVAILEGKKTALLNLFDTMAVTSKRRGRPPGSAKPAAAEAPAKKRKFSPETRKKLRDSKKAYWDKVRAEKAKAVGKKDTAK